MLLPQPLPLALWRAGVRPIAFAWAALVLPCFAAPLAAAESPAYARAFNTENTPGGPLPPAEAAAGVKLPPGFRCTVFAAEPDVAQPIAIATDARGRLWVAENYTYSERTVRFHAELRDRIVILEDVDGDGRFDKRTVFWEGAQRLTSVEPGAGGVWALSLPNLVFIPDRDGDDRPDGPPEVVLDGFDFERARHNVANGLRWGPDGWLYGRHGILGTSVVGPPGAAADARTAVSVGIWRFHPQRRTFEIVGEGTTNPWGMDWDQHGEAFFINTVIGHLWQVIPGAHYKRMFGPDRNPRVYELLDQAADHVHWASGEVWTDVRKGVSSGTSAEGGGHAHTGLLIYQGGQWPAAWEGKLLTVNFHGRRLNVERLEPSGSAIVGRREPDAWFRGLDLLAAPDGGVFVSDWSDAGECHDNDGIHRTSGRIYLLTHGAPARSPARDLTRLSAADLAARQSSANDWEARQARRVLANRAVTGGEVQGAAEPLRCVLAGGGAVVPRLRALWALHVSGLLRREELVGLLGDREDHVRVWAVRLLVDDRSHAVEAAVSGRFAELAAKDTSPRVRLALAAALQRIEPALALPVAAALVRRAEDAADHNIPLMLWYGLEALQARTGEAWDRVAGGARIPAVSRLAARALAEGIAAAPAALDRFLMEVAGATAEVRAAALEGMLQGFGGRSSAPAPAAWAAVRERLAAGGAGSAPRERELSALFGDERARDELRQVVLDRAAAVDARRAALEMLVRIRVPALRATCEAVLAEGGLAATALAGLAVGDDPAIGDLILAHWGRLAAKDRAVAAGTLVTRPAWAARALDAVQRGAIPRSTLTGFHLRQVQSLGDATLIRRVAELDGAARPAASKDAIADWTRRLTPVLVAANLNNGRATYEARCAACHRLNGAGGAIGPDLTGAARDNLGYLLENILFPSATVPDDYRLTTLTLKDGRVVGGVVRQRTPTSVTLQSMAEAITVATADITKTEVSEASLMPAGLLEGLSLEEARDLFAFLMSRPAGGR